MKTIGHVDQFKAARGGSAIEVKFIYNATWYDIYVNGSPKQTTFNGLWVNLGELVKLLAESKEVVVMEVDPDAVPGGFTGVYDHAVFTTKK